MPTHDPQPRTTGGEEVIDLRLGRYQDVLADIGMVDCIVTDPPYSARTHEAQCSDFAANSKSFFPLEYVAWDRDDVQMFVEFWQARNRGWWVVFSDHALQLSWESALGGIDLYVFAPIPQVTMNRSVRLAGDGPATWTTWITVARPRHKPYCKWGALQAAYIDDIGGREAGAVRGAKQHRTMQAIIRDYSRPGDLICDPCAGGGTTLIAAASQGRKAIGAEMDPVTHAKAMRRIEAGYTPDWIEIVA